MLRLKKIKIGGFKSISLEKPLELELGDVTILLGANGSGKSNIISFFKMLGSMMDSKLQLFVEKSGTSQLFLNYGSKRTSAIEVDLLLENSLYSDNYMFELAYAIPDRLIVSSEKITRTWKDTDRLQSIALQPMLRESALSADVDENTDLMRRFLSNCKVYQFHDSSATSLIRQSSRLQSHAYLQVDGGNLVSFLHCLKNNYPANYRRIVNSIRQIMPDFNDFYIEPNEKGYAMLRWTDTSTNDYIMLPEQFSDGTLRFIALASLLLQPKETIPDLIVIDEPELGLHPYAVFQLAEMIKEASINTQVIVATQSPGLIDEFEAKQIAVVERDADTESTVAHKLNEGELAGWLERYSL